MANCGRLSTGERKAIIRLRDEGETYRSIAKIFNKTPASIFKVVKTFRNEGRVDRSYSPGRPKITTKRIDIRIKNISASNPKLSVPKILSKLALEGKTTPSLSTIRRRLYVDGKHGRDVRKIPFISQINKAKRMKFYADNVLKPESFWYKILWTDESMIRMKYNGGQMYVWRKSNEALSFKCTKPTLKSGDKGLMVWGCISAFGVGKIVVLEGKTDSQVYLNLMKNVIVPEGKRLIGEDFILQQDNAPIHKAKIVSKYIADENINILEWPPQSPDLSPIENTWAWLKTKISESGPRNLTELKDLIIETWQSFTPEMCRKYVLSLPRRLALMSQNNGGHCGH